MYGHTCILGALRFLFLYCGTRCWGNNKTVEPYRQTFGEANQNDVAYE